MGRVVDLSVRGTAFPDLLIVDSNLIIAYFLSELHQPLPRTAARANHLFHLLQTVDGVGIVPSPCLQEILHAAIKMRYRVEIDKHVVSLREEYPRQSRYDWIDLYKINPDILKAFRTDLAALCQLITANNLLFVQPEDVPRSMGNVTREEMLVDVMADYGLDSNDALMLLEARQLNVTSIATLDADLQRAATDFDIYTWLS